MEYFKTYLGVFLSLAIGFATSFLSRSGDIFLDGVNWFKVNRFSVRILCDEG